MFVPVSSTSHLALTQHALLQSGSQMPAPDSAEMILFDIVVHVGTLVSIVVVMREPLGRLIRGLWSDTRTLVTASTGAIATRVRVSELVYVRLAMLGAVTVAVTGVLGIAIRAFGTGIFGTPMFIAFALAVTGVILWWTDTVGPRWRGAAQLTVWVAVGIGIAQAAALIPGLSRSGLTIAMALALGDRKSVV